MADLTLQQLRSAALEVFNLLSAQGIVAEQSQSSGRGLPHAMWLCFRIGRHLQSAQRAQGYMGFVQAILIYEGVWTQAHMLDRALAWSQNQFDIGERATRRRAVGPPL